MEKEGTRDASPNESYHQLDLHDVVIIELCCGTAGVTSCFKRQGLSSCIAVDKHLQRRSLARVVQLDLTKHHDQQLVLSWLQNPNVLGIFWAPPCGTCSKAREIDLPDCDDPPRPLRSVDEPDGFTFLQGTDLLRVSQANIIYSFVAETFDVCHSLNKLAMCENPMNSLFWYTTAWKEANCADALYFADHQACAYGSQRPKWTRLAANFPEVLQISDVCPQNHKHAPWGRVVVKGSKRVFATSLEVHYPLALCNAIVRAFLTRLHLMGFKALTDKPSNAASQQFSGKQPVTTKLPPLVPEFKCFLQFFFNDSDECCWPSFDVVPSHYKILHKFKVGKGSVEDRFSRSRNFCVSMGLDLVVKFSQWDHSFYELRIYGVPWEPMEFIEKAKDLQHPLKVLMAIPGVLKDAVDRNLQSDSLVIAKKRLRFVLHWNSRVKQLQEAEVALRRSMDGVVSEVTRAKRICLFSEMLASVNYPDMGVVDELREGVNLVGDVPETHMLPKKFSPALLTKAGLDQQSSMMRKSHREVACSSGDAGVDDSVWKQTLEEVKDGWLDGPIPLKDIPVTSPISRRFGLVQKDKIRLIDDFSASGVNSCVNVYESPSLHTVDVVAALLAYWSGESGNAGTPSCLRIRTFDLASAYRQMALSSQGRKSAYIAVYDPQLRRTAYFACRAVPFGAVRSVHSFLRLSRAIWWLGTVCCDLMWTSYFDDFIVVSQPSLVQSTGSVIASLFRLTGWLFAEEGKKAKPFDDVCKALGVVFDVSQSSVGKFYVKNTEERVEELRTDILDILSTGFILGARARSLQGRMLFADSQIFGRVGRRCTRVLAKCADKHKYILGDDDKFFLKTFVHMLDTGPPREIGCLPASCGTLIFTDACFEKDAECWRSGVGGVLYEVVSESWRYFSLEVSDPLLALLGEGEKEQLIFEVETLAAVMAYILWTPLLSSQFCFLFVDNEGTKFSLVKGFSDNACVCKLVQKFALHESETHIMSWISRVPSYSNVADGPSRNDVSLLVSLRAINDSAKANDLLLQLVNSCGDGGKGC